MFSSSPPSCKIKLIKFVMKWVKIHKSSFRRLKAYCQVLNFLKCHCHNFFQVGRRLDLNIWVTGNDRLHPFVEYMISLNNFLLRIPIKLIRILYVEMYFIQKKSSYQFSTSLNQSQVSSSSSSRSVALQALQKGDILRSHAKQLTMRYVH